MMIRGICSVFHETVIAVKYRNEAVEGETYCNANSRSAPSELALLLQKKMV